MLDRLEARLLAQRIEALPEGERLAHVYQRVENDQAPCGQLAHQRHVAIWLAGIIRGQMADSVG